MQGNFKLSTTQNKVPSDDDLFRTISNGMPGSAMPPWGHFPKSDIDALVSHVRKIFVEATRATLNKWVTDGTLKEVDRSKALADQTSPGPALSIPPEPSFDEIHWFRGRRLYLENCASCHGADGEPVAAEVKFDAEGYPVPPRSFVNGVFKGGSESHQLYARVVKGDDLPSVIENGRTRGAWLRIRSVVHEIVEHVGHFVFANRNNLWRPRRMLNDRNILSHKDFSGFRVQ